MSTTSYALMEDQEKGSSRVPLDGSIGSIGDPPQSELTEPFNGEHGAGTGGAPSFADELWGVFKSPSFLAIALGYAAYTAVIMGVATFGPTFLLALQFFEKETQADFAFGAIAASAGFIGTPLGGWLNDYLTRGLKESDRIGKSAACFKIMVTTTFAATLLFVLGVFAKSVWVFIFLVWLAEVLVFIPTASITMSILLTVENEYRAFALGLSTLILHAFGDVPSPIIIADISSVWAPDCGAVTACCSSSECVPTCCNTTAIAVSSCPTSEQHAIISPLCKDDNHGMRMTLLVTLLWLLWAPLLWGLAYSLSGRRI